MITFKSSTSKNGRFKDICIINGNFVDNKTGEIINLAEILLKVYGEEVFEMTTTQKTEDEIE